MEERLKIYKDYLPSITGAVHSLWEVCMTVLGEVGRVLRKLEAGQNVTMSQEARSENNWWK